MTRMLHLMVLLIVGGYGLGSEGFAQQSGPVPPGLAGSDLAGEAAKIRPGDRIALRIWREPDLSGDYRVGEDGYVVLPKLGVVRVIDQSAGVLQDSLRVAYSQFLRNPSIEIVVYRRIGIHGEVNKPDLYWVDLTMTLRDVIALAGGMTQAGNPDDISIIRGTHRIQFGRAESAAFVTAELQSGDQVVVGRRSWLSLNAPFVISTGVTVISVLAGFILAR